MENVVHAHAVDTRPSPSPLECLGTRLVCNSPVSLRELAQCTFVQDFATCTETDKMLSDGIATAWVELFKMNVKIEFRQQ